MQLVLVLALLPFIYALAWLLSPVLAALHSIVTVGERLHTHLGPLAGGVFLVALAVVLAAGVASRRFLWFGILPVIVGVVVTGMALTVMQ